MRRSRARGRGAVDRGGPRTGSAHGRLIMVVLTMQLALTCGALRAAAQGVPPSNGNVLRTTVGFTEQVFGRMDIRDVRAATRTWAEIILRRETGRPTQAESRLYRALPLMEKDLAAKTLDLVALMPHEYLEMKGRANLDVIMLAEPVGSPLTHYVIVVRKDGGASALTELRGSRVVIEAPVRGVISWLWLESTLRKAGLPQSAVFFAGIQEEPRGAQAVLAVFFKKADACVAARHSLETMVAMNPQVGQQLAVLAVSPGYAHGLMAVRTDIDDGLRNATHRGLANLHTHATGRQVLTLFRTGRMIPFKPEQLNSVKELLRESQ